MCRAYPGQVECRRAGCILPICVEKETGIRHPFCSIQCAIACGETPRSRPHHRANLLTQAPNPPPPAYKQVSMPKGDAPSGCLIFGRRPKTRVKQDMKDGSGAGRVPYVTPPQSDTDTVYDSDDYAVVIAKEKGQ